METAEENNNRTLMSRRDFLKFAGRFALGATGAAILSSCNSNNTTSNLKTTDNSSKTSTPETTSVEAEKTKEKPSGNYILLSYASEGTPGQYSTMVSLFFNNQKINDWPPLEFNPIDPQEPTDYLYFTKENSGIDERNVVVWRLKDNEADIYFDGKEIETMPIWTYDSVNSYKLLPRKEEE